MTFQSRLCVFIRQDDFLNGKTASCINSYETEFTLTYATQRMFVDIDTLKTHYPITLSSAKAMFKDLLSGYINYRKNL